MKATGSAQSISLAGVTAAAISLAVSAIVLLGWATERPALAAFRPDWTPMQPGAAAGLVLVSFAALLLLHGARRTATALAAAGFGGAVLALLRSGLGLGPELDGVFVASWPPALELQPTGTALDAAVGLLFASAAVAAAGARLNGVVQVCAAGAWILGATSLIGHATGLDGVFPTGAPMAPATAGCLLLVSSTLLWGRRSASRGSPADAWTGPALAGLGAIAMAFLFHQALLTRQQEQIDATIDATAERIRTEIRVAVQAQRNVLSGLAREWEDTFFRRRRAWESDVRIAIAQSPSIASIAWFETDGGLVWRYPSEGDDPHTVLPPPDAPPRTVRSWTRAMRLSGGSRGFALLAPLLDSGEVEGWLHGTYRSSEFFGELSKVLPEGFAFQVDTHRSMIFDGGLSDRVEAKWVRRLAIERASNLTLTLHPTPEWLAQQRSSLPRVILAAGLGFAVLLVVARGAAQTSAARAVALEGEVEAHERAEAEIRRLNLELEDRVARRTAELRQSNEELAGFATFLSHELRQPIAAQALWADLLASDHASRLDAEGRECVAEIRRHIRRTGDLIGAQLALAEIGTAPLRLAPIELDRVVDEVRRDLKAELDAAQATIHHSKLPRIEADSRLLYQLFRNLIENSIKYRRPSVALDIRAFGRRDGDEVEVLYADNGRGFDPADAQRIFGVFERAGDPSAGGIGVGLAVCRRIVERFGGSIRAEAEPDRGATFRIRFPALDSDSDPDPDGTD